MTIANVSFIRHPKSLVFSLRETCDSDFLTSLYAVCSSSFPTLIVSFSAQLCCTCTHTHTLRPRRYEDHVTTHIVFDFDFEFEEGVCIDVRSSHRFS